MADPTLESLLKLNQKELDALYSAQTSPGTVPHGDTKGTAVFVPGTGFGKLLQAIARIFFWSGKRFATDQASLVNIITIFHIPAIKAKVYPGNSWLDGNPSTFIDYSKTSFVAKMVHDEIREVAPGLFLGKVYLWKKKTIDFILVQA